MSNFDNEKGFIAKFSGMKKYAAPVVLFVLACALIVYLKVDFSGSSSSFDVSRYMQTRAKIDSLEVALWNSQGNVDAQVKIRDELSNAWEDLSAMRTNTADEAEAPEENVGGFSGGVWLWIIGGTLAVLLCSVVLVLVLIHRKKIVETRMMEALAKSRETGEMPSVDDTETVLTPRVHAPKKSIIDEAEEFAAKRRETMALQTKAAAVDKLFEIKDLFEKGLSEYRKQHWDKAEEMFHLCNEKYQDMPSVIFLDRIAHFKTNPPPKKWDGVFVMKVK